MSGTLHRAFEVREASQVGEVRRAALRLADTLGFDDVQSGRVALIATELGGNLVRHARDGRLLLAAVHEPECPPQLELISIDAGPGMADISACLRDGYSTGSTPGTGLGAVRRLADVFDLYSQTPAGTVILARVGMPQVPCDHQIGGVALSAPGESVCGDGWSWRQAPGQVAVLVADGLGHGPQAEEASQAALAVFEAQPFQEPAALLERVHQRLRSTRGAAVSTLRSDATGVLFCGVGNVVGRVISGTGDRTLLSQHGTAGLQIRKPQPVNVDWPTHALVVLHSDGLQSRWHLDETRSLLQRHPTLVAAWLVRDHVRGRDDVTVVVLKRNLTP